jgi:hypothetical protein
MIERRRLFFRSDFLRDMTHPCPVPRGTVQSACVLSRNNGATFAKQNRHPNGRHGAG